MVKNSTIVPFTPPNLTHDDDALADLSKVKGKGEVSPTSTSASVVAVEKTRASGVSKPSTRTSSTNKVNLTSKQKQLQQIFLGLSSPSSNDNGNGNDNGNSAKRRKKKPQQQQQTQVKLFYRAEMKQHYSNFHTIDSIVRQSNPKNTSLNITGRLIIENPTTTTRFVISQVLYGRKDVVEGLYGVICRDERIYRIVSTKRSTSTTSAFGAKYGMEWNISQEREFRNRGDEDVGEGGESENYSDGFGSASLSGSAVFSGYTGTGYTGTGYTGTGYTGTGYTGAGTSTGTGTDAGGGGSGNGGSNGGSGASSKAKRLPNSNTTNNSGSYNNKQSESILKPLSRDTATLISFCDVTYGSVGRKPTVCYRVIKGLMCFWRSDHTNDHSHTKVKGEVYKRDTDTDADTERDGNAATDAQSLSPSPSPPRKSVMTIRLTCYPSGLTTPSILPPPSKRNKSLDNDNTNTTDTTNKTLTQTQTPTQHQIPPHFPLNYRSPHAHDLPLIPLEIRTTIKQINTLLPTYLPNFNVLSLVIHLFFCFLSSIVFMLYYSLDASHTVHFHVYFHTTSLPPYCTALIIYCLVALILPPTILTKLFVPLLIEPLKCIVKVKSRTYFLQLRCSRSYVWEDGVMCKPVYRDVSGKANARGVDVDGDNSNAGEAAAAAVSASTTLNSNGTPVPHASTYLAPYTPTHNIGFVSSTIRRITNKLKCIVMRSDCLKISAVHGIRLELVVEIGRHPAFDGLTGKMGLERERGGEGNYSRSNSMSVSQSQSMEQVNENSLTGQGRRATKSTTVSPDNTPPTTNSRNNTKKSPKIAHLRRNGSFPNRTKVRGSNGSSYSNAIDSPSAFRKIDVDVENGVSGIGGIGSGNGDGSSGVRDIEMGGGGFILASNMTNNNHSNSNSIDVSNGIIEGEVFDRIIFIDDNDNDNDPSERNKPNVHLPVVRPYHSTSSSNNLPTNASSNPNPPSSHDFALSQSPVVPVIPANANAEKTASPVPVPSPQIVKRSISSSMKRNETHSLITSAVLPFISTQSSLPLLNTAAAASQSGVRQSEGGIDVASLTSTSSVLVRQSSTVLVKQFHASPMSMSVSITTNALDLATATASSDSREMKMKIENKMELERRNNNVPNTFNTRLRRNTLALDHPIYVHTIHTKSKNGNGNVKRGGNGKGNGNGGNDADNSNQNNTTNTVAQSQSQSQQNTQVHAGFGFNSRFGFAFQNGKLSLALNNVNANNVNGNPTDEYKNELSAFRTNSQNNFIVNGNGNGNNSGYGGTRSEKSSRASDYFGSTDYSVSGNSSSMSGAASSNNSYNSYDNSISDFSGGFGGGGFNGDSCSSISHGGAGASVSGNSNGHTSSSYNSNPNTNTNTTPIPNQGSLNPDLKLDLTNIITSPKNQSSRKITPYISPHAYTREEVEVIVPSNPMPVELLKAIDNLGVFGGDVDGMEGGLSEFSSVDDDDGAGGKDGGE